MCYLFIFAFWKNLIATLFFFFIIVLQKSAWSGHPKRIREQALSISAVIPETKLLEPQEQERGHCFSFHLAGPQQTSLLFLGGVVLSELRPCTFCLFSH